MLSLNKEKTWRVAGCPVFIKSISFFFNNSVITAEMKSLIIIRFKIRIRRFFAEAFKGVRELSVENNEGLAALRTIIKAGQ